VLAGVLLAAATTYAAVSVIIAQGAMAHSDIVGGPATVTMRTLTISPGEVLGWHYHPGSGAYTIVAQGTLLIEDGCGGEATYAAGEAFLEPPGRVHRGKNLTGSPVVTAQTFITPVGGPFSVSTTQLCGPPLTVAECKDEGWVDFNHPRPFASQGDCMQFVVTGR
jgi:quercetin dioxygenase-like cupin family protein